jgi:ribose 5-phosphate isomerase A
VAQFGWEATGARLEELDTRPELRCAGSGEPFVTDGGNFILDCLFASIEDPAETERRINAIVGVVENGLFVGRSSAVIVASEDGVEILTSGGTVSR